MSASTLTGNLTVAANGVLNNGGFSIALASGKNFSVAAGAQFNLTGTSTMVTVSGVGTKTFNATSTVNYGGAGQAVTAETYGHLTLSGSGTKTPAAGTTTIVGNYTLATGVTYAGNTNNPVVNLAGNFSNSGTFNSGTGTFTFNGTGAQTLSGTTTFTNLLMNNSGAGLTINNNVTVSTVLTLTSGVVTTGANTLITSANCPGSISRTGGHVAGFLGLQIPTGSPTCTFDVGDSTTYRPVNLTFSSVTTTGNLTGSVSQSAGDHPNISTSGLDDTQSVNRYWTLTNSGVVLSSYSATFNFVAGDVDGGADPLQFEVERWDGSAWNTTTVGTRTGTTTQATGITAFSDFASGKKKPGAAAPTSFNVVEPGASATTGKIFTKIAGQNFSLDIVALDASNAILTGFTGAVAVEVVDNTSGGACSGLPLVTGGTFTDQTFVSGDNGRHSLTSPNTVANVYRNAKVRIKYPTSSPTVTACSVDNFAIRPASFSVAVTDATWATAGTPRALNNVAASGGNVHKAGQPFTITVTPSPGTATNYSGDPTVSALACTLPTPCANGALAVGTFSGSGTRVSSTATYTEAGAFNLTLIDQTFASVDLTDGTPGDCTAAGRYVCQSSAPLAVGRFVPDHFDVTAVTPPVFRTFDDAACATRSFTYIGQPFGYNAVPAAMIAAKNSSGGTTANYAAALWKLTNASASQTFANSPVMSLDTSQIGTPTVAETPGSGTGTFTANAADKLAFTRDNASPRAPFNANLSLTVSVSDATEAGASQGTITTSTPLVFNGGGSGIGFDSGAAFRYGRLAVRNANGSQLVPLPVPVETQYFVSASSSFVTNAADHCTTLTADNVSMANFQGNLGPLASCKTRLTASSTFTAGRGNHMLSAPDGGDTGSVDLTVQLGSGTFGSNSCVAGVSPPPQTTNGANRAYLQGNWTGGAYTVNPSARAAFGVFKGAEEVIFIRENF